MLSVIYETPFPKLVNIEDSVELSGQNLFQSIVNIQSVQCSVILFCLEKPSQYYKDKLKNINNVQLIDGFNKFYELKEAFEEIYKTPKNVIVAIDSVIECFLLIKDFYNILRKLLNSNHVTQIINLLHGDCVPSNNILAEIKHISNVIIVVTNGNISAMTCMILTRRPGRKVITEEIFCWIDESGVMRSKKTTPVVKKESETDRSLPADLATFRIELNEQEKKSRDQVVLPYTQIGAGDSAASSGGGKIIYELEVADDWDEEDPDDDLDV